MNINTFLEAKELYDKYTLCETVLKYLSDEEIPQGQKYLETLKIFVNTFQSDFMMFVHERMEAVGMAFEDLKCCDEQLDVPAPPSEPKEQKFAYGEKVEITDGDYKGKNGMVMGFDDTNATYYIVSPQFSMWFPESDLKAYTEEELPETPEEDGGTTEVDAGE